MSPVFKVKIEKRAMEHYAVDDWVAVQKAAKRIARMILPLIDRSVPVIVFTVSTDPLVLVMLSRYYL